MPRSFAGCLINHLEGNVCYRRAFLAQLVSYSDLNILKRVNLCSFIEFPMPYEITWEDEEKTLIKHVHMGKMPLEEYYEILDKHVEFLAQVSHPVDLIVDALQVNADMKGWVQGARYTERVRPSNQRMTVIVSRNSFVTSMLKIASRLLSTKPQLIQFAQSMDEAHRIVRSYRKMIGVSS